MARRLWPGYAADVGCGTGQVARLLAASGWQVVGVEIDLIASGQAWHWIDPEVGYRRAAELLRPRGRLALFWSIQSTDGWLAEMRTHSPVTMLGPGAALLADLRSSLGELTGDRLQIRYETRVTAARRR